MEGFIITGFFDSALTNFLGTAITTWNDNQTFKTEPWPRIWFEFPKSQQEPMQPDKALIAILIKREHSRLANQVKALEKLLEKPHSEANSFETFL